MELEGGGGGDLSSGKDDFVSIGYQKIKAKRCCRFHMFCHRTMPIFYACQFPFCWKSESGMFDENDYCNCNEFCI